ncbi:MAG: SPOR domain-containing protein [Alphaproteobacteria bacterium]
MQRRAAGIIPLVPAATSDGVGSRRRDAHWLGIAPCLAAALCLAACANDGTLPAEAPTHVALGEVEGLARQIEIERATSAHAPVVSAPAELSAAGARPAEVMVELAAVSSAEAALGEWERLRRSLAAFDALKAQLRRVDDSGETARYRLSAGPFPNTEKTAALCTRLARRGLACLPAD